ALARDAHPAGPPRALVGRGEAPRRGSGAGGAAGGGGPPFMLVRTRPEHGPAGVEGDRDQFPGPRHGEVDDAEAQDELQLRPPAIAWRAVIDGPGGRRVQAKLASGRLKDAPVFDGLGSVSASSE